MADTAISNRDTCADCGKLRFEHASHTLCTEARLHKCMRCNEEFVCPNPATCQAKYDVMPSIVDASGNVTCHCPDKPDWDWIRAYGERRAAAPELLEALKRLTKWYEGNTAANAQKFGESYYATYLRGGSLAVTKRLREEAKAAIRKAEGGAQ